MRRAAALLSLAALVALGLAAGANMCVNEGDLLASAQPYSAAEGEQTSCQEFSDSYESFGVDWSAASVCDDLKTINRGVPDEKDGVMWEWQLGSGATCCGSWEKAKCLAAVTLDTCDGAYVKWRELFGPPCARDENQDYQWTQSSCGTDACKGTISSIDDAALAQMIAGLQVCGTCMWCLSCAVYIRVTYDDPLP